RGRPAAPLRGAVREPRAGARHLRRGAVRRRARGMRAHDQPAGRGAERRTAVRARDGVARRLRRRARRLGVQQPLVAARRHPGLGADDLLRDRDGPRADRRRAHLQHPRPPGDRARPGPPAVGMGARVGHPLPAPRLRHLPRRRHRREQAHPVRPAGERIGAGERILHGVLRRQAPDVHDERLRRGGAGRRPGDDALLRRLAGAVPGARRLPFPVGSGAGAAVAGRGDRAGHGLRPQDDRLHLAPDRHSLDAAALPLRSAHAARLEGAAAAVARQRDGLGAARAAGGAGRVSVPVFLVLAALLVAAALTVVTHPSPVYSACALVLTLFLLSVFFVGLDAPLVAALQVIVYAGAIVVLFLFVIMLLNLTQTEPHPTGGAPLVAVAVGGGVALVPLAAPALRRVTAPRAPRPPAGFGETA